MTKLLFQPPAETQWNVISLGAGVQSSVMALMATRGLIKPMPDFAIFADTQDETPKVYDWLDWLEKQLAFPLERVSKGKLSEKSLEMRVNKDGKRYSATHIPVYTLSPDGTAGMVPHRSCTTDYKIQPILKAIRQRFEIKRGQKELTVTSWIGISYDEMQRMKNSREAWVQNRWPLVERRMTRQQCLQWMQENGYPEPPRSSCVYCPFHSDAEWRRLQTEEPEQFAVAVEFERKMQAAKELSDNFRSTPFLHRSRKPLDQIDFRNDVERGQGLLSFMDECDGMCGV